MTTDPEPHVHEHRVGDGSIVRVEHAHPWPVGDDENAARKHRHPNGEHSHPHGHGMYLAPETTDDH